MKRLLFLVSVTAFAAVLSAQTIAAQTVATEPALSAEQAKDKAAISKLLSGQNDAWNRGDAAAFANHFAEDGCIVNIVGVFACGRDNFIHMHEHIFATIYHGSTLQLTVRKLRFLTSDVAIADIDPEVRGYQALPPGTAAPADGVLRTRLEEVLVKRNGEWWVVSFHNVAVNAMAMPAAAAGPAATK